jgi:predicted ABC-type sugar transport system permease subunit
MLGSQAKKQNVNNANGLDGLLGGLLGGNSPAQEQSFLESMLDADGDGSVIDDVAGMVLGGSKKKGGLGGLLGGLFGGK